MNINFRVLSKEQYVPDTGNFTIYLKIDGWNDYGFVTMFYMSIHDEYGQLHNIGYIKIGCKGQMTTVTYSILGEEFKKVGDDFFSLGQGVEFYRNMASLPFHFRTEILLALRDIVLQPDIIEDIKEEAVFSSSLLRSVSLSAVKGQYARVLNGLAELTDFRFSFVRSETERLMGIDLSFEVIVGATPSTNIHAVIGRNGVGKTTLLNGMIDAITNRQCAIAKFIDGERLREISNDHFSTLVSVSFSAFDPFKPPPKQPDPANGTCYFYIGLKDPDGGERHRTISDLQGDCVEALICCFYQPEKTKRWLNAIDKLGSDEGFASINLGELEAKYRIVRNDTNDEIQADSTEFQDLYKSEVIQILSSMSSGHASVLLIVTRLVATVEEKTLVLLDEPESHLHPPLLSAFVRAVADLLHDRNGVAIIATHSPVVLQEIPKSCVWKIYRVGDSTTSIRPDIETFAENVGVLTREVFGLEIVRSGFHDLLVKSVEAGSTYEEIINVYNNQLGFEGRAILMALIANRDRDISHDETN